eukprot:TRINITY_DN3816_c1_g1_i1.p4 TRINITY_DN3816_c1_g1~~TRINITY_DN3816_c1_g1_i1.p4  ORF type:complete len:102 (-),score=0.69 TRINITY_DN3816_c1_g1_i1:79-384(-)
MHIYINKQAPTGNGADALSLSLRINCALLAARIFSDESGNALSYFLQQRKNKNKRMKKKKTLRQAEMVPPQVTANSGNFQGLKKNREVVSGPARGRQTGSF